MNPSVTSASLRASAPRKIILTQFRDFGLARPITQALADEGHETPTPIQNGAIPAIMQGRDFQGVAQTGTGKTAAFALPILHHLAENTLEPRRGDCRVLVLAPTRELAAQVLERFQAYGKRMRLRTGLVIGGAPIGKQKTMARNGLDVLVATPGRLVDLMNQKAIQLNRIEMFVLDEVDQMLDLGFIHAIRTITNALPNERQNIFLSATMPPPIKKLAASLLTNPARVEIAPKKPLRIDQSVVFIEKPAKSGALLDIVKREDFTRGLVFSRTKHGADKIVKVLNAAGAKAFAIHGNRSQSQRERALDAFRKGKAPILVATDIAARGIDITGVSHVVNYDLPNVPETYVHRIGRTGRAGKAGVAISFCSREERPHLRSIERLTKKTIATEELPTVSRASHGRADDGYSPSKATNGDGEKRDARRKQKPGFRPGQKPGSKFGKKPGSKSGGRRGAKPGHDSEERTGARSEFRSDAKPGSKPGAKFTAKPGSKVGAKSAIGRKPKPADGHPGKRKSGAKNAKPPYTPNRPANEERGDSQKKGQDDGKRGTARVRRRRHRGSPGRQLSGHAG